MEGRDLSGAGHSDEREGASTPEMSKEQFADDNQKAGQGSPRQPPATSQRWLDIWRDQMSWDLLNPNLLPALYPNMQEKVRDH